MKTAAPYSCQTGRYTIDQLGGEDCANCGQTFRVGEPSQPGERIAEWQLFMHVKCPTMRCAAPNFPTPTSNAPRKVAADARQR